MKSSTETLINALQILAQEIESPDGVANQAIAEAAERLQELSNDVLAKRVVELSAERDTLAARVEQLRKGFSDLQSCSLNSEYNKTLSKIRVIFNATPAQCLAEVRAQAGRDGFMEGWHQRAYHGNQRNKADAYANQLRQQAQGEQC